VGHFSQITRIWVLAQFFGPIGSAETELDSLWGESGDPKFFVHISSSWVELSLLSAS
jgi:hypothetical protein